MDCTLEKKVYKGIIAFWQQVLTEQTVTVMPTTSANVYPTFKNALWHSCDHNFVPPSFILTQLSGFLAVGSGMFSGLFQSYASARTRQDRELEGQTCHHTPFSFSKAQSNTLLLLYGKFIQMESSDVVCLLWSRLRQSDCGSCYPVIVWGQIVNGILRKTSLDI